LLSLSCSLIVVKLLKPICSENIFLSVAALPPNPLNGCPVACPYVLPLFKSVIAGICLIDHIKPHNPLCWKTISFTISTPSSKVIPSGKLTAHLNKPWM
jgi:hypothetical protein